MANLTRTFEDLRSDLLSDVADRLAAAERVWVAGLGAEAGLARHARIQMARIRPAVHLVSENTGTWAEELASTGPSDALLVIALRPWLSVIEAILDFARTTRLDTIVVTDPTNAARTRRHGATALVCHISSPARRPRTPRCSRCSTSSRAPSPSASAKSALRRRDLIADLREELDPQD